MPERSSLSLEEVSIKLGVSPSAIKKRVASLHLPVMRGARGKLIFDQRAFKLLAEADGLLKAGYGFDECRKRLGLDRQLIEIEAQQAAEEAERPRRLPTPVFISLRKRKAPGPAALAVASPLPDLLARLDGTLKLIEEKDRHNQMLQARLMVAFDEITKLTATASAHQERSGHLQQEVQRLQGELRLLAPPAPPPRPWWKLW